MKECDGRVGSQDELEVLITLSKTSSGMTLRELRINTRMTNAKLLVILEALRYKGHTNQNTEKFFSVASPGVIEELLNPTPTEQ